MYKSFFGLRDNPFNVNPDPRFLHRTPRIQEALDQLIYGVQNRKGLILLTGEVGTGKTTLINYLLDWLHQQKIPNAFIFNSHLSVNHLFDFILHDFGISTDFQLKSNMLLQLNQWLIERFRAGDTPVLIVDEAQGLSLGLLEEIRLLLNLETASEKLLQIILVGQPELEAKLRRPEMRQLRQRIALRCDTAPLTLEESRGYIADRLRIAGATGASIFAPASVEAVHFYSRGIPRVMNLLCEHALINAYVEGLNPIPPQMVEEAAREFLMDEFRPLSTHSGVGHHPENKLSVMQSIFPSAFARPFPSEQISSREDRVPQGMSEQTANTVEQCVLLEQNRLLANVPEHETSAISEGSISRSLSAQDLAPALLGLQLPELESDNSAEVSACQAECAGELMATMGRLLESASSRPLVRPGRSKIENKLSATANHSQTAGSKARILSLDSMNRMPASPGRRWNRGFSSSKSWRGSLGILHWLGSFSSTWSRMPVAVLPKIRNFLCPAKSLVKLWIFEFRRDWSAMINAIAFRTVGQSLLHWLREPTSSKRMAPSKSQSA